MIRNVTRNVNRHSVYHNGRRDYWRNGVFVALPVAGAAAGYVASCAYEYNRCRARAAAIGETATINVPNSGVGCARQGNRLASPRRAPTLS
jgi:hypothetical protein